MTGSVMQQDKTRITIVGGGSVNWAPKLVRDMLLTPPISNASYVLFDIDVRAAELAKAFLEKLAKELKVDARFVASDKREALAGSSYIVIAISTGGLDAMQNDIAIPEKYGIYHTVGDTSGPGGWSRLIRNFDAFVSLAEDINRHAPGAVVLNYSNPMTGLTDILCHLCHGPVIGLCHGLFQNLALLMKLYNLSSEDEIAIKYAGINHFFWATEIRAGGQDVIADLTRRLETETFTDLLRGIHEGDPFGFKSNREVATELFRLTGVMPYLGDRHTCEFFSSYITNPESMESYRIVRTTIEERRTGHKKAREHVLRMIEGDLDSEYLKRSRETAADIIEAHSGGKTFIDVGNVPNIGQISNLPQGLVVETAVRVDANGFSPISFGALPGIVQGFIEPYGHVMPMTVDACLEGNRHKALQALRLDPVCSGLSGAQVIEMGESLLHAHREFISAF